MSEPNRGPREAYLCLALVPGIGSARISALLRQFGCAEAALAAPVTALQAVSGISAAAAQAIGAADRRATKRVLTALARAGGRLLLPEDSEFPERLREIPDPPTHLFVKGDVALLTRPAVAIVGSRDHSSYGGEVCRALARAAAQAGLVVVSGMARGLDALAHLGALDGKGGTIGVLGNGIGVTYPAANRRLYDEVSERGLLITEFPPGERPGRGSFPRRNRLISGLARVTVIVEAARGSGALQTSTCAQDQGREVMAVPGPVTSLVSWGPNDLIRDGSGPLLELADLLDHYPELPRARSAVCAADPARDPPLERSLLRALAIEPLLTEQLLERCGAPVVEALDALASLELAGRVRREAGGRFRLAGRDLF